MLIRRIVLSVSVKAWALTLVTTPKNFGYFVNPKRATSKILHFRSTQEWTCFDFMRSGNSKGWVEQRPGRLGPSIGARSASTVALMSVYPVLSHTDWPMFYIVMGWVVFLAITLAHYVKR